jgi:cytochrome c-type biogenesis protein CcmE
MKITHIVALLAIAVCIGILISVMGSSSTYASFKEAKENPGKEFHVIGHWQKTAGYIYDPVKDPNYFAFTMEDSTGQVAQVVLHNDKPQDFERSEKVVVVGKIKDKNFEASQILMKCPSKYNAEQPQSKSTSSN